MKKILSRTHANFNFILILIFLPVWTGRDLSIHRDLSVNRGPSTDYRIIFGDKYQEACNYFTENTWISDTLIKHNIDPCFAQSIIFPEIIRYSYIRDKMEIQGLLTLYVQYGEDYANFSIGRFQIKPSFAHQVEIDANLVPDLKKEKKLTQILLTNTSEARLARVKRLEKTHWQLQYLSWFIKINEKKYKSTRWQSPEDKLRIFATAYNCGYTHSLDYLKNMSSKEHFHTSLFNNSHCYNYGEISLSYWLNCKAKAGL